MKIKIQIKLYKKQMMEQLEKTCTVRKQGQIDETETRKNTKRKFVSVASDCVGVISHGKGGKSALVTG